MPEVGMAARTMGHARALPGDQLDITAAKVIRMNRQEIWAEDAGAVQVFDGRAKTAIAHVAFVSLQPLEHFAPTMADHVVFLPRLGNVGGQGPSAPCRQSRCPSQQSGQGGVGGVW